MEVKIIGKMDNTIDHTFESANRVYDKNGISPTINTCGGGGLQPKVIDAQAVRMVRTEEGKALRRDYENGTIHHGFNEHREMELRTDGVSNTLSTVQKDNYICEKSIVAMRGRNPDNPSDRTVGSPTEQRLEPNSQGICNTLTSVQKDNLVLEQNPIGSLYYGASEGFGCGYMDNCYKTVKAEKDDLGVVESVCAIDEQNMNVRNETFGTLTTDGSSPKHNNRVMEYTGIQYRIRKLTPRECWRLMDFSDEDFHKAEEVNSNTQLYKQAGNSICKNVLVAIFGQMLDGKEDVYKEINSTHFPNQQQ